MMLVLMMGGLIFYAGIRVGNHIGKAGAISSLNKDDLPVSGKVCAVTAQTPKTSVSPGDCPNCTK
eukprot:776680-Pyramimonas_sp.AAC.1